MGSSCSSSWPLSIFLNSSRPENSNDNIERLTMSRAIATIPATVKQTATLIFLHGLGDYGESWSEAFAEYRIPEAARHVKFLFPTAPVQKVTLNMGMPMTTWFDIHGLDQNAKEDQAGIEKSSKLLQDMIEQEIQSGISPERVIVGGFSMGGAVALHAALTSPHRLGGVLALSTWLPLSTTFPQALISGDKKVNLPILQCHGNQDPMIQIRWARLTEQGVKAMGLKQYEFKEYNNMGHSSCDQEMKDVSAFVVKKFTPIRMTIIKILSLIFIGFKQAKHFRNS